jgi:hypothetical protein
MLAGLAFMLLTMIVSVTSPAYADLMLSNPDDLNDNSNGLINSFYIIPYDPDNPQWDYKSLDKTLFVFLWEYTIVDIYGNIEYPPLVAITIKSVSLGDHKVTITIDHKMVEGIIASLDPDEDIGESDGYVEYNGDDFAAGPGPGWRKRG